MAHFQLERLLWDDEHKGIMSRWFANRVAADTFCLNECIDEKCIIEIKTFSIEPTAKGVAAFMNDYEASLA